MLASAAAPAQTLTLRGAVEQALRSHPLLAAGEQRIGIAAGQQLQASLRPNPTYIFQTENWRTPAANSFRPFRDTDTFLYLSNLFETAGKRDRRIAMAGAVRQRSELERDLIVRQIAARVKLAYWDAAGAQKVHELLLENGRTFQQIVEYHETRVREGAMAEADLLKVQLESERFAIAANAAQLDAERARIAVFREMGATAFPAATLADALDQRAIPPEPDAARALEQRVEARLARQGIDQARRLLGLEQSLATPNVEALAGYKRTAGVDTALFGFQVDLPLLNRNQGNVASAHAQIRAAESELAATEALIRAEVRVAAAEVQRRREQLEGMLPRLLERATESSRIALAAYREGGADLLRLLDSERVRIELQVLYYRTLADYRQSLVTLETAMGELP